MDNVKPELSKRYYVVETAIWLLSAILIASRFFGLDTSQPLPVLNVILEDKQNYPRVVAALLIASMLYLFFEWKQSSRKSRESYWSQARAGLTTVFAGVSLWLSFPIISANTGFAVVSPGWFLGFLVIGFFLGEIFSILIFSSLMIRTPRLIPLSQVHWPGTGFRCIIRQYGTENGGPPPTEVPNGMRQAGDKPVPGTTG